MKGKKKPTGSTDPDPDIDGGWAWMVLAGSSLSLFLSCLIYIGGIFNVVFLEVFGKSKQATAWLLATQSSLLSLMAPISSCLIDRFGCRCTCILGGLVGSLGYILAFFSHDFVYLFLSFGILVGIGFGLSYCPSIVVISLYFDRRRNLAYGAVTACVSIGTILMPRLINVSTDIYGWRGCLFILAGLLLQQVICGCVFRPKKSLQMINELDVELKSDAQDSDLKHHMHDVDTALSLLGNKDEVTEMNSLHLEFDCIEKTKKSDPLVEQNVHQNGFVKNDLKPVRKHKLSFMSNKPFLLYSLTIFLLNIGSFICYIHFPAYFIEKGATDAWISNCYLAAGIANILCRLLGGLATNSEDIPVMTVFIASCWLSGLIVLMCPILAHTGAGQICFSVFLGLFGWYFSLMAPVTIDIVGKEDLPMAYGMQNLFGGIGGLVGPPFAGLVFVLSGVLMMVIPVISAHTLTCKRKQANLEKALC